MEKRKKKLSREDRLACESYVLANIKNYKWSKRNGLHSTVYSTTDSSGAEVLFVDWNNGRGILKYNATDFRYANYNSSSVKNDIESTRPTLLKSNVTDVKINNYRLLHQKPKMVQKKESQRYGDKNALIKNGNSHENAKKLAAEIIAKQQANRSLTSPKLEENLKVKKKKQIEHKDTTETRYNISPKDFVVRRAVFKCMHSHHQVQDIDATLEIVDDNGKKRAIQISAGYCKQCQMYFIMESTYEKLRRMGVALCRICDEKTYMKNSYVNGMQLAQESILMQFGYSVSQQEGLSQERRQKILAVLIDNHILSKSEIISYLDFFISQRQSQSKYMIAISKWEADREFLERYRIGHFTKFGVNAIYRV